MNFLGMGPMEVLLILLVAFIFLGPSRMIESGRSLGRAIRQLRRMSADISESWLDEDDFRLTERPIVHKKGGRGGPADGNDPAPDDGAAAEQGGPVRYRAASEARPEGESEARREGPGA